MELKINNSQKISVEFEVDIEMEEVYDGTELEKVLKERLIGYSQTRLKRGYTFKITGVREL